MSASQALDAYDRLMHGHRITELSRSVVLPHANPSGIVGIARLVEQTRLADQDAAVDIGRMAVAGNDVETASSEPDNDDGDTIVRGDD